ncbi:hypothetical protein L4C31_03750 [Aliivibrio sifiae]|uniref:hypothetical protein n=1 Tax=Aliivibrio fischeri TaxID=668 RepID=UPI0012DA5206|nr:hypothetical protein [Aliivibrio fischeri]MUJ27927.1 hypothetical protein [Aliivibrio fischeri]
MVLDVEKNKFMEHFPFRENVLLQILKGHLLIEEVIREIVDIQVLQPEALKGKSGASFDCHQMICLAQAITPEGSNALWVWDAAKKLNSLRNKLAHQLSPKGIEHKVNDFTDYVSKNIKRLNVDSIKMLSESDLPLTVCILSLNAALTSLKDYILSSRSNA